MIDINNIKITKFDKILCDFNALYDYDDAIVKFVLKKFRNSKYIKKEAYYYTPFYRHYLLHNHRENDNPLSIIFKEEYIDRIEDLYKEIFCSNRKELMKYLEPTNLNKVIKIFKEVSGYSIFIDCETEEEKRKISKSDIKCNSIDKTNIIEEYFACIFRDYERVKEISKIEGKTIYFWDYYKNFEYYPEIDKKIPAKYILSIMDINIVKFITPYQDMEEPVD